MRGLRIVGTDADAPLTYREADLRGPLVLVIGSEGRGLAPAVRRRCDLLVRIPMRGRIESLNAAVAGSVLVFEAAAQRGLPERPAEPWRPARPAAPGPDELADDPAADPDADVEGAGRRRGRDRTRRPTRGVAARGRGARRRRSATDRRPGRRGATTPAASALDRHPLARI